MNIPIEHYLIVTGIMFFAGVYGFIVRKNMMAMLISLELMLNAAVVNFCVFNRYLFPDGMEGMFFALFTIAIAAAETAVAIAIILHVYRNMQSIDVKKISKMKH